MAKCEEDKSLGALMVKKQAMAGQPAVLHTGDSSVRNVTHFTFTQAFRAEMH